MFKIMADRHRDRLEELLAGGFEGIVTSDRWWAYDLLDVEQRQACWSHLQRDFRFHSEGPRLPAIPRTGCSQLLPAGYSPMSFDADPLDK